MLFLEAKRQKENSDTEHRSTETTACKSDCRTQTAAYENDYSSQNNDMIRSYSHKMACRLCVNNCHDFINIFDCSGLEYKVSNLIQMYFTFQVTEDDEHSTIICRNCLDNLRNFYSFCTSVEIAQGKWQVVIDDNKDKLSKHIESDSNDYESEISEKEENQDLKSEKFSQDVDERNENCSQYKEPHIDKDASFLLSPNDASLNVENHESSLLLEGVNDGNDEYIEDTNVGDPALIVQNKSKKFRRSEDFDRLIESNINLACNECSKPMESFKTLKKHYKNDHGRLGYMLCCNRKFFRAADLADHISIHLNPEFFKCLQCGKRFSSRYSLDFHLKTFHANKPGEKQFFKCKHCSVTFSRKSQLDRHKQTQCEAELDANKHLCLECGKSYSSEPKLKAHHFNVHTMVYSRMCHLCGKIVRGNKALERHQLQHAGIKPKVRCEICGTELSTKGILKAHMIALHPEDSSATHVCNECGKNAPSKRALKYHMDYVHKCERTHECRICDKSFKRFQALKEHLTTHTGDRLYECPHCPKTFKVCSNMHHHRKLKHPREFEENRKNRTKRN